MSFRVNLLPFILTLPLMFIQFWFFEGPQFLLRIVFLLFRTGAQILSLPLLVRTFFAPWKGEYRKGYVGIAIGVGVVVRFFTIVTSVLLLSTLLLAGILLTLLWIALPVSLTIFFLQGLGVVRF